ncbi:hypothetical protein [uncultured Dialister sp.]|uniref:hypothetical protein n=1 Tax=uncultured Dialister sp. TaxID=278064 RepID=UPI0025FE5E0E|nr:hypothetical protein [uncultured Dialister sp.]
MNRKAFVSELSGVSGVSGLPGRCAADAARVFYGPILKWHDLSLVHIFPEENLMAV